MSDGFILPPGAGRHISTGPQHVTFKVTGEHSRAASSFEVLVPPGFDVGAHVHAHSEELFYVLEGEVDVLAFEPQARYGNDWAEWQAADGQRVQRAGPGSVMFVPPGCPHAFANHTDSPARMFFQSAPPSRHERYFEELLEILNAPGGVDSGAVAELRHRHDIEQLTPLRFGR
ncbi:cupin domain-containing protein [Streptomyces palmae]|nr:cupin domain-containing protein [Streptomyces palmae]